MTCTPTSIYLIGNPEHNVYKIGVADDVARRLKQVATACPYALALLEQYNVDNRELAFKTEKKMHELYADKRIRTDGEWFFEVDKNHFKESVITTFLMVQKEEERLKNEEYVSGYEEWYNSTKQTQGDHPIKISLRLLGNVMCPMCMYEENVKQLVTIDTPSNEKLYCRNHGSLTIEEYCTFSLDRRDCKFNNLIPMESDGGGAR